MKTQTILQLIIAIFIVIIMLFFGIAISELNMQLEQEAKPCEENIKYVQIKDLPELNFNWTPINERTEKPAPLPTLHFNTVEK